MSEAAPVSGAPNGTPKKKSDLGLRVLSSLVLIPLVIGITWWGGWPFALLWGVAAIGIWFEWCKLTGGDKPPHAFRSGGTGLVIATVLAAFGLLDYVWLTLLMGVGFVLLLAPSGRRVWTAGGMIYAGAALLAPVVLRQDASFGFVALLLLYAVVWGTDIGGYFGGRAIGGPKLWRRVSPNKTWSGAVSGTLAAIVAGLLVAHFGGAPSLAPMVLVILVLSVVSQAGDLFESGVKRRFDVKDSSHILPGHGGLMDRLDGFLVAAAVAALIGIVHGGLGAPARGLMAW